MYFARENLSDLFSGEKQKIFGAAVIIFALITVFFIYKKQTQALNALNTQKNAEIRKNEILMKIGQSENKFKFYKELIKEQDPAAIAERIRGIAEESGLRVISINNSGEENTPLYNKYSFSAVFNADGYHNIGNFISKMENYSQLYAVERIEIKKTGAPAQPSQIPVAGVTADAVISVVVFTG